MLIDLSVEDLTKSIIDLDLNRKKYKKMVKNTVPKKLVLTGDPLGGSKVKQTSSTSWETYHQDNDIKKIILLDLNRTYQDITLFHSEIVKNNIMTSLYVWSKENPLISYKQGMNEIYAVIFLSLYPLYFVYNNKNAIDTILSTKKDQLTKPIEESLSEILDKFKGEDSLKEQLYQFFHNENEIYADTYLLFDAIMTKGIKDLYDTNALVNKSNSMKDFMTYKQSELFQLQWRKDTINSLPTNEQIPLQRRCSEIVSLKLKLIDPELFDYFNLIDLDCTVFLQRWIKCMFNRELEYPFISIFWDSILANDLIENNTGVSEKLFNNFNMIDYICVSMISAIKDERK